MPCRSLFRSLAFGACLSVCAAVSAEPLDLSDYRGKVLYLDFWASWCVPCKQSFPWMNELHHKYKDQGLEIVAVSVDQRAADMQQFLTDYPVDFSVIHDADQSIAPAYQLIGMPTSFLYGRDGELIGSHAGYKPGDNQAIEAYLAELLAK